jgi:hypothetical protein
MPHSSGEDGISGGQHPAGPAAAVDADTAENGAHAEGDAVIRPRPSLVAPGERDAKARDGDGGDVEWSLFK